MVLAIGVMAHLLAVVSATGPAQAACTPTGPYDNSANTVVCNPGANENLDTAGGGDSVTVLSGPVGTVPMGSGNAEFYVLGGVVVAVDQGSYNDLLVMSGGTAGAIDQGSGTDRMEISAGFVTGGVFQNSGRDTFVMSGGTIGSLNQGSNSDFAFINGGTITDLFFAGDYVEFAGGSIGQINLESTDNIFYMWGTASVIGGVNSE
ncbi:MAG: hypothetical protein ACK5KM_07260, partial [Hyphomicrobiaceae bacterium]